MFSAAVSIEQQNDLVSRIESGDRSAESELVEKYTAGVRLILLQRTGNPHLCRDLCQDTFVVALRRLRAGALRNPEALSAFVRRIAINVSIDHYRKEKRYIAQDAEIILQHLSQWDEEGRNLDDRAVRMALEDALGQLAIPRDREILRRFYLADEEKERICAELNLTSTHFDRVLYRARSRIRELINEHPRMKELLIGALFDD